MQNTKNPPLKRARNPVALERLNVQYYASYDMWEVMNRVSAQECHGIEPETWCRRDKDGKALMVFFRNTGEMTAALHGYDSWLADQPAMRQRYDHLWGKVEAEYSQNGAAKFEPIMKGE